MPTPWVRAAQETGELTVFPTKAFLSAPAWGDALLTRTLDEFNRLAALNQLGVRLERTLFAPRLKGPGANVQIDVSAGPCQFFDHDGATQQATLNTAPGEMHGFTAKDRVPPLMKIVRAFVFVPIFPVLGRGLRGVGPGPKIALLLHELLHAVGLDSSDPGHERPPGNVAPDGADLYMTDSVIMPGSDTKPQLDKELVGGRVVPDAAGQFFFSARTVAQVQSIWLLGQF